MKIEKQIMDEYEMLRDEISYFMKKDTDLSGLMFTVTGSILTLACTTGLSVMALICFCIIIPICYKMVYHRNQMAKIASYMRVFLEPDLPGRQWETRLKLLKGKDDRARFKFNNAEGLGMAIISYLVYLYLSFLHTAKAQTGSQIAVLQAGIPALLVLWVLKLTIDIDRLKAKGNKWEEQWIKLKEEITNGRIKG